MWFPNSDILLKASRATAFILLTWEELFGEQAPDSFRPRLYDTYELSKELKNTAKLAYEDERWKHHIRHITNELIKLAKNDPVLEQNCPRIKSTTENLRENEKSQNLFRTANVALSEIEGYSAWKKDVVINWFLRYLRHCYYNTRNCPMIPANSDSANNCL